MAEGVSRLDSGLYLVTTQVESEAVDPATGTLIDTGGDTATSGVCLSEADDRRIGPDSFADPACTFAHIRPDPYGVAFDAVCAYPYALMAGEGTLAVDPTRPTEFHEAFTLRGEGAYALQRVTIRGRRIGACPSDAPLAGPEKPGP